MQFRRSVQLFKGLRINFSQSGISTTIGRPGASINISPKGTYLNVGLPGTGIYHREKISDPVPDKYIVSVTNEGTVEILDANWVPITNESIVRRIKRTEGFKSSKLGLMNQLRERIEQETFAFTQIHRLSTIVSKVVDFENSLLTLKPRYYEWIPLVKQSRKKTMLKPS